MKEQGMMDRILRTMLQQTGPSAAGTSPLPARPNYQRTRTREAAGFFAERAEGIPEKAEPIPVTAPRELPSGVLLAMGMQSQGKQEEPASLAAKDGAEEKKRGHDFLGPKMEMTAKGTSHTASFGQIQWIGANSQGTMGFVIPHMEPALKKSLGVDDDIRAIGVVSARSQAALHLMGADDGIKKSNCRFISTEWTREEGSEMGAFLLIGSRDVADAVRGVEAVLAYVAEGQDRIWRSGGGRTEYYYTARTAEALHGFFRLPMEQAAGILIGSPAGVGMAMADTALKAAKVEMCALQRPSIDQRFYNETWLVISGEPSAVQSALEAGASLGQRMLTEAGRQGGGQ